MSETKIRWPLPEPADYSPETIAAWVAENIAEFQDPTILAELVEVYHRHEHVSVNMDLQLATLRELQALRAENEALRLAVAEERAACAQVALGYSKKCVDQIEPDTTEQARDRWYVRSSAAQMIAALIEARAGRAAAGEGA